MTHLRAPTLVLSIAIVFCACKPPPPSSKHYMSIVPLNAALTCDPKPASEVRMVGVVTKVDAAARTVKLDLDPGSTFYASRDSVAVYSKEGGEFKRSGSLFLDGEGACSIGNAGEGTATITFAVAPSSAVAHDTFVVGAHLSMRGRRVVENNQIAIAIDAAEAVADAETPAPPAPPPPEPTTPAPAPGL